MSDDSFADAPESIATLRARRSGDGRDLAPRDVLVETLRAIDRGEIAPTCAVVAMRIPMGKGDGWILRSRLAGLTYMEAVGLLTMAAVDITTGSNDE